MDKKIMAIVAAAIVVVAAIGAVVLVNQNNSSDNHSYKPDSYPDGYLTVLGNVNGDNAIDDKDKTAIKSLVDSGKSVTYSDYYMYDVNYDGKIDNSDVDKVSKIIDALKSNKWDEVGTVHYVNVDHDIMSYDMTKGNHVITLIAPPLDSVLAMGGKDLVVGTDNRITTGKYHAEYATALNFSKLYDVGSCNEPSTETITKACKEYGDITVVCGTNGSYGPTMEKTFAGTDVQVVRIASWEYGGTLYGFMTLAFLLKLTDGANTYYDWYQGVAKDVQNIVKSVPDSKKAAGMVGAACVYCYADELSLLGLSTGEYANMMVLDPYDTPGAYYKGKASGGHGDTITTEGIVALYQQYHLRNLYLMVGTPFQVTVPNEQGNGQATVASMKALYDGWSAKIGTKDMTELRYCLTGYSFSSGVSEVLNQLIFCYFMYNDEFMSYFKCSDNKAAQDVIASYVDAYCKYINIDDMWSMYGEKDAEGKVVKYGMNLLYCGEGSDMNIMYGLESGVIKF